MAEAPFRIFETAFAALIAPFRMPLAFLLCAAAPAGAVVLTNVVGYFATHGRFMATQTGLRFAFRPEQSWIALLLTLVTLAAYVMFALAWQRQVFHGSGSIPERVPVLRLGRWYRPYLMMLLKLLGVMIVPILIGALVVAPLLQHVPTTIGELAVALAAAIGFALLIWWLIGRCSVAIGSAAVDQPPLGFKQSWRATAPVQGRILAVLACVGVAVFLFSLIVIHTLNTVFMPIGFRFSLLPFILFGLGNLLLALIQLGWTLAAIALIHRRLGAAARTP